MPSPTYLEGSTASPRALLAALGTAMVERSRYQDAVLYFQQALAEQEARPLAYDLWVGLAKSFDQLGQQGRALRAFLEAAMVGGPDRIDDVLPYVHAMLTRGSAVEERDWLQQQWIPEVARTYLDGKEHVGVALTLGRVCLYVKDYPRARDVMLRATQDAPYDPRLWEGLGEAFAASGDLPTAIDDLAKAKALVNERQYAERLPRIMGKLARAYLAAGRHQEALACASEGPTQDEAFAYEADVVRGHCYLALGRPRLALDAAEAAARRRPAEPEPYVLRVRALVACERCQDAVKAAHEALERDPSSYAVLLYQAQALVEGQIDTDQAERLLRRYQAQASEDELAGDRLSALVAGRAEEGNAQYFLAWLYRALDRPDAARQAVDEALRLGPRNAGVSYPEAPALALKAAILEDAGEPAPAAQHYFDAGCRFSARGEYALAEQQLRATVRLASHTQKAYWYLADAVLRLAILGPSYPFSDKARLDAALEEWERGYALDRPSAAFAWAYLTRAYILGALARHARKSQQAYWWQATVSVEQALVVNDTNPTAWTLLGQFHHKLGNEAVSMAATARALALAGDDLQALATRAAILAAVGDEHAIDAIERYRVAVGTPDPWPDGLKGYLLCLQGRFPEALAALDAALKVEEAAVWLRYQRGRTHRLAGEQEAAAVDLQWLWSQRDALSSLPEFPDRAYIGLAGYYLGCYQDAVSILQDVLAANSYDPFDVRVFLSLCHVGLHEFGAAEELFGQALTLLRNDRQRREVLQNLGELTSRSGSDAAMAQSLDTLRRRLGEAARQLGTRTFDEAGAAAELRRALRDAANAVGDYSWLALQAGLGRVLVASGSRAEAGRVYGQIVAADAGRVPPRFPEAAIALSTIANVDQC